MVLSILTLLGSIALLLYGLNIFSNGLQKYFGGRLRTFLPAMTTGNRFHGILASCGLTATIQSSSAATVMIVSLVNSAQMTLSQAVAAIMGANIGTTITAWIITLFLFSVKFGPYAYIVMALGYLMNMSKNQKLKNIGQLVIGIALFFVALTFMQSSMTSISATSGFADMLSSWTSHGAGSIFLFVLAGMVLATVFQSSSAAIALTIILLSIGSIGFDLAVAMVLGENIGTTLTASLAAAKGNVNARRAALIHLLFNVLGAILILILFNPFCSLMGIVSRIFGAVNGPLYGVCLSHTMFNILGTCLLIWFTEPLVRFVSSVIAEQAAEEKKEDYKLRFITAGRLGTPSLSLSLALKETINFGAVCYQDFGFVKKAINAKNPDEFEEIRKKLVYYEEVTDKMEYEIAHYLNEVTAEELSTEENSLAKMLYRIISEMESLGDSGENISRLLERTRIHNITFTDEQIAKLNKLTEKVGNAFVIMNWHLKDAYTTGRTTDIRDSETAEDEINRLRDFLREETINKMDTHDSDYQALGYFLDLLSELEAMGDFIINISQALIRKGI